LALKEERKKKVEGRLFNLTEKKRGFFPEKVDTETEKKTELLMLLL
jgi:hypothetical protein